MKPTNSILILLIAAGMATAQTATPPAKPPAAKPATAKNAERAPKPPAATSAKTVKAKPAKKAGVKTEKTTPDTDTDDKSAADKERADSTVANIKGRRDPFVSIITTRGTPPTCLTGGKACLVPGQVVVKGIVKSGNGMLAVVENYRRQAFFLRENDPVFNGQVSKITSDSVIFKEKVVDKKGKQSEREVIRRVGKIA